MRKDIVILDKDQYIPHARRNVVGVESSSWKQHIPSSVFRFIPREDRRCDLLLLTITTMHISALQLFLAVSVSVSATAAELLPRSVPLLRRQTPAASTSSLWVSEVPTSPQPYAVRHYGIPATAVYGQIYRFPVTGPSSDYAFTLISTASPGSGALGVLPHTHLTHYENFFCLKGRLQLWTSDAATFENEEARLLTPGDYGAVPHNTTHTFQVLDP